MNWLVILAVLGVAGCPRKTMTDDERKAAYVEGIKPVLAKHQRAANAAIDALETIPTSAAAEPRVTALQPLPAPAACNGDTCVTKTAGPVGPISFNKLPTIIQWEDVPRVLRGEFGEYSNWQSDNRTFESINAITHLAVVRVHEFEKPVVSTNADRYTGGRAAGDVIVYDVKTKNRVGAFAWAVQMPETARIRADATDPVAEYQSVLVDHAKREIQAALADLYAGKAPAVAAPKDMERLRERQISDLLAGKQMPVMEVEITDGPTCKVVLVTALKHLLAVKPDGNDGVVKPEAIESVRKVMAKECAVSYREP